MFPSPFSVKTTPDGLFSSVNMPVGLLQFPEMQKSLNETSSIPEPLVILASIFEENPIKESFALLLGVCDKSKINLLLLISNPTIVVLSLKIKSSFNLFNK